MKKILAVLVLVLFASLSYGQWATSGTSIYNTNTGNVGIGITAPVQLLHLYNATKAVIFADCGYAGTPTALVTLSSFNLRATGFNQGFQVVVRRQSGGWNEMLQSCQLTGSSYAEFQFFRYDTQKWEMRPGVHDAEFKNVGDILMNNSGTGRVGIGVTSWKDGVKFQVNGGTYVEGRIRCHEVEVALATTFTWPDYVFSSDYKLPSLYDVENFIQSNSHLPGVPSQAEIANDGVKLGEMNATLLKKVEELTLYMINLQKENDALKVRVSALEK